MRSRRASRVSSAATPPPTIRTLCFVWVMLSTVGGAPANSIGRNCGAPGGELRIPQAVGTSPCTVDGMDVVIVGGGVAGLEALLALRAMAGDRGRLALAPSDAGFTYPPPAGAGPVPLGPPPPRPPAPVAGGPGGATGLQS